MVARQDVQYLAPLDFRTEPYEVRDLGDRHRHPVLHPGAPRSATRGSGTVYATAGTVVVGSRAADHRPAGRPATRPAA